MVYQKFAGAFEDAYAEHADQFCDNRFFNGKPSCAHWEFEPVMYVITFVWLNEHYTRYARGLAYRH